MEGVVVVGWFIGWLAGWQEGLGIPIANRPDPTSVLWQGSRGAFQYLS